eukprot:CAMPEP_0184289864 /NCGR_PEP_ID=MMETSP1049-20130417/2239_1 /TAXON_ID=77928 /ORGANISM="Proteomonas sulcata, Strain CCMP704" /LENGTH=132 /DNA_ID=CAMNT_0026596831 /DNA_START=193 /DNA_END=591 /DNA_ORIENTATION=+
MAVTSSAGSMWDLVTGSTAGLLQKVDMQKLGWAIAGGLVVAAAVQLKETSWRKKPTPKKQHMLFRTKIKKNKINSYIRYHQGVWPEVEMGLREAGVRLLSIHQPMDGSNEFAMFIELQEHVDLTKDLGPGSR